MTAIPEAAAEAMTRAVPHGSGAPRQRDLPETAAPAPRPPASVTAPQPPAGAGAADPAPRQPAAQPLPNRPEATAAPFPDAAQPPAGAAGPSARRQPLPNRPQATAAPSPDAAHPPAGAAGPARTARRETPMPIILILAAREVREGVRNRWVLATTLLLAALALTLALLGSAPTGTVGASRLDVVTVSLASLTIFLVPLIALLLSHDAIAGEAERGTLLLLLAYPVSRGAVILGKFAGQLGILALATVVGYGTAAVAVGWNLGAAAWGAFAAMVGASVLLGAVFLALGLLASTLAPQRSTAGGVAIGLWLLFVLIYDMAFLGLLVASGGRSLPPLLVDALLALNPTDAYRLITLGAAGAGGLTGIGALAGHTALTPPILVAVLVAWTAAPLALAAVVFARREL